MTDTQDSTNTAKSASVDWTRPIEAVYDNGQVVQAQVIKCGEVDNDAYVAIDGIVSSEGGGHWFGSSGKTVGFSPRWDWLPRIRNVQPKDTVTIPRTAAEVRAKAAELGDGSNSNRTHEFIGKLIEYGFLQTLDTPAFLLSQHCNITEEQAARAIAWMERRAAKPQGDGWHDEYGRECG